MLLVFKPIGVHGSRKLGRVALTSVWFISYSRELCNINCIFKTSEPLIMWSTFCYNTGLIRKDAIKGTPQWLLKWAAMMF